MNSEKRTLNTISSSMFGITAPFFAYLRVFADNRTDHEYSSREFTRRVTSSAFLCFTLAHRRRLFTVGAMFRRNFVPSPKLAQNYFTSPVFGMQSRKCIAQVPTRGVYFGFIDRGNCFGEWTYLLLFNQADENNRTEWKK